MTDDSIEFDHYRGTAARKATGLRRLRLEVQADQAALRVRQDALERMLVALLAGGGREGALPLRRDARSTRSLSATSDRGGARRS
jgi:hypothetical protein